MTTEQNNGIPSVDEPKKLGMEQLWQDLKKHRKLFYKVLPATFVIIAFLTLCMPNYYKCTVMLAPELSGNRSAGSLSSLASSFGFNIGGGGIGADAIMPNLYPDLMNSVTFKASLFDVKVHRADEDEVMTYYDYLAEHQKRPWWSEAKSAVIGAILSLLPREEVEVGDTLNTFRLTKDQSAIIDIMNKKVVCDVDQKTFVITIDVTDQDPLIAATMADSVQVRLQEFITEYRTRKARIDLDYTKQLFDKAKTRYEEARKRSAAFNDANQRIFLDRVRSERTDLENEMQIQYSTYSQVAAQLQLAEAKVQQETPAFTLLQPATVPVKKVGPRRALICLFFLFMAFVGTGMFAFHKEGHLKPLMSGLFSDSEEENSQAGGDGEYYILSKCPPTKNV